MTHYIEMGGGLGDIFQNCYVHGGYRFLSRMPERDSAAVVLITHNPYAVELFRYHPRAAALNVRCPGYWTEEEDREMRMKHGLPINPRCDYPHKFEAVQFYPSPDDLAFIAERKQWGLPYLVVSQSAGLPERDIPEHMIHRIVDALADKMRIIFVGRNYERDGRKERGAYMPPNGSRYRVIDAIDRLTVPGVAELVRGAAGVVSCHSAVSMVSWYMRRPNLLLYPRSVVERHILKKDQYAFGCRYAETVHGCFSDKSVEDRIDEFIERMLLAASLAKCELR